MRRFSTHGPAIAVFFSLLCIVGTAGADTLDIDDFIQAVLNHNPGVQRILAEEAIAAGQLKTSEGIDDPLLGSSGSFNHTEPNRITGFEANTSDDVNFDLSLSRTFSASGTRLSTSYGNQYTDRDPPLTVTSLGASYYQPSITLQLTQPLLKNAGGRQDRLDITLNRLSLQLARLESRESLESYITQLAALYLDWYLAYREALLTQEEHQHAIEQEKLVRLKVRRQVAEPYELLRVQETREDYYSRWQQALGRAEGLRQQIMQQMAQNGATITAPNDPGASRLLSEPLSHDKDYLTKQSRLKVILDTLEMQQKELLDARKDARRPDLDLSLSYTRHGVDESGSDAHGDAFDADDYGISLQYRYPLGNRASKGAYESQLATQRQVSADSAQRLIDAKAALADLMAQAKQIELALAAADRKLALAKRKLKEERRLYRIGKLDLFELLQDQTSYLESRLSREQLYVQLQQLRLSIGELLDRNLLAFGTKTAQP